MAQQERFLLPRHLAQKDKWLDRLAGETGSSFLLMLMLMLVYPTVALAILVISVLLLHSSKSSSSLAKSYSTEEIPFNHARGVRMQARTTLRSLFKPTSNLCECGSNRKIRPKAERFQSLARTHLFVVRAPVATLCSVKLP